MNPIRLGTIGSGTIVRSLLNNAQRTDGISLEAVYSRSPEKGAALAAEYGCEKVYTDMDAFLADPSIDLIYIATPNLLHYEQAKRALEKGKHVLLEGTKLLYLGSDDAIRNAFSVEPKDNTVFLPGVMSRKKQVIPMLTSLWG